MRRLLTPSRPLVVRLATQYQKHQLKMALEYWFDMRSAAQEAATDLTTPILSEGVDAYLEKIFQNLVDNQSGGPMVP
jgi:hypothetical protein